MSGFCLGQAFVRELLLSEVLCLVRGCFVFIPTNSLLENVGDMCGPQADIGIKKVPVPSFNENCIFSSGIPLYHLILYRGLCHHGGVSWTHLFKWIPHGWVTLFPYIWSSRNICFLETVKVANAHFNKKHTSHLWDPAFLISCLDSYLSSLRYKLLKAKGGNVRLMQWHAYTIRLGNLASLSCTLWRNNGNLQKNHRYDMIPGSRKCSTTVIITHPM